MPDLTEGWSGGVVVLRNMAFSLGLAVVAAALGLGYLSTTRIEYFPPSFLSANLACDGKDNIINEIEADWYPRHWRAAEEPSFYLASRTSNKTRSLRFTWLRTFEDPVIVRIDELAPGKMRLTAKQLSGAGGYDPGEVARTIVRDLTVDEQARFAAALTHAKVFELPPVVCEGGSDGARWIVEATGAPGYQYVNRWSPQDGPVHDLGLALLGLTGWRFERAY